MTALMAMGRRHCLLEQRNAISHMRVLRKSVLRRQESCEKTGFVDFFLKLDFLLSRYSGVSKIL